MPVGVASLSKRAALVLIAVRIAGEQSRRTAAHSDRRDQTLPRISASTASPCRPARRRARESCADGLGDAAGALDPAHQPSRFRIVSRITSLKVRSAAAGIAMASAWPSGCPARRRPSAAPRARAGRAAASSAPSSSTVEARSDVGLERKLMQQPRAEGMDGLHLEAARRLQRAREQAARPRALRGVGGFAPSFAHRRVERRVVERGPGAQCSNTRFAMLAAAALVKVMQRMRLGSTPEQQQPDHALRQHVGLAGAGIGGDPGRRCRGRTPRSAARSHRAGCRRRVHSRSVLDFAAGQRPFLDAREVVVVAVMGPPHRMDQRAVRLGPVANRRTLGEPRQRVSAWRRRAPSLNSIASSCRPARRRAAARKRARRPSRLPGCRRSRRGAGWRPRA